MTITPDQLAQSFIKYRAELLTLITLGLQQSLDHMTLRTGIRYKEYVGQLTGDMDVRPYNATATASEDTAIVGRALETFLGSVVKPFDPNSIVQSVYGSAITKGEQLTEIDIVRRVAEYLVAKMGKTLNAAVFSADRDNSGTTTATLFNGFDTIAHDELALETPGLSVAKGNYNPTMLSLLTASNVGDALMAIYEGADPELQAVESKMFMPYSIYNLYNKWYRNTFGAVPYNQGYSKIYLEGSAGKCELVPMANKANSKFIQLTTRSNMLIGMNLEGEEETLLIEKSLTSHFKVDFVASLFFGCQYETLDKARLVVVGDEGTYTKQTPGEGANPKTSGWYELASDGVHYVATNDTSAVEGKNYYARS